MTDKKEEIMQSAIRLISEKGYFSTSVQEIANDCGISKGSLYKYFDSKENLLIEVIEHNHRKMFQRAMNVDLDPSLTAKEKLIKKIVVQLEDSRENKDFMMMLFQAMPNRNNENISSMMKRIKVTMMTWHKECLMKAFGSEVESYIWDLVLIFQGTLKEYLSLTVFKGKTFDMERAARFIVERLDAMIQNTAYTEPALGTQIMKEFEKYDTQFRPKSGKEQLKDHLNEMVMEIERFPIQKQEQEELLSAVHLLEYEVFQSEPRDFQIKALLLYLAESEELGVFVRRIEKLLEENVMEKEIEGVRERYGK
ncbi:MAG TPA: TetR/AcrR family transcriptional regulator [Bacillales bacterium]|nr:TetR/AcrR family transcriptional regulator [Bacillales bacterium]